MKTIEELSAFSGTTTNDIKDFFTKIILDSIEKVAEANRFGRQLTRVKDLKGESTDSITVAMEQPLEEPSDIGEGETVTPSKIALTPKEIKLTKRWGYGLAISQEAIDDCKFDLIQEGTDRVGRGFAIHEDKYIFDTLLQKTEVKDEELTGLASGSVYALANKPLIEISKVLANSTDVTDKLKEIDYNDGLFTLDYNATEKTVKVTYTYSKMSLTQDVKTKGTLSYDDVIDGQYQSKEENEDPSILVLNPKAYKNLLKDDKFIDASKYGSNQALIKGEIGMIGGLKVLTTTDLPSSCALMLDPTRYMYLLTKGGMYQKMQEEASNASHELYFFMRLGSDIVNSKAGVLVTNLGTLAKDLTA